MPDLPRDRRTNIALWFDDDLGFLEQVPQHFRHINAEIEIGLVRSLTDARDMLAYKIREPIKHPILLLIAQHEQVNFEALVPFFEQFKFSSVVSDLQIAGDAMAGFKLLAAAALRQQPNLILCTAKADENIFKVAESLRIEIKEKRQLPAVVARVLDAFGISSGHGSSSEITRLNNEIAKLKLERRRLRRRIEELQRKKETSNKKSSAASNDKHKLSASLQEMQRLVLSHSHDLNSVSSFVSQTLDNLCSNRDQIPPAVYPDIQRARTTAKYLDVLVRSMGSVIQPQNKIESGVSKINDAVKAACEILYSKTSGRISVEYSGHDPASMCAVPGDLLVRILLNIMVNAIDSMPKGGTIAIRTRKSVRFRRGTMVEIRDNGRGIRKVDLPKVFESTFSTKGKQHGFGLFIVRKTLTDYKGRVNIKSIRGKGTTVLLELPNA